MAKDMLRDDYGYINNRGVSKYWGVTVSKVDGKDIWVVNFKPRWAGGVTCGYRPYNHDFKLKELDAAKIAAFLYEQGEYYPIDEEVKIRSVDGKYVFSLKLNDTKIYRQRYTNQKVWERPSLTLDLLVKEETPLSTKQVNEFWSNSKTILKTSVVLFVWLLNLFLLVALARLALGC